MKVNNIIKYKIFNELAFNLSINIIMKCFILCGGLGTRLSEETNLIPKPMIKIGNKPILEHIMDIYSKYGFYEFVLWRSYKINKIKDHFLKKQRNNSDIFIDFNMSK